MLHACNAVDGTAKKMYPSLGVGARFRKLLRENYNGILEPMVPGINFEKTVFPISISSANGPGGPPDVADVLYVIHRCHHGHGAPLPVGWELIPDSTTEPARTTMNFAGPNGQWVVRLSDRIIFGMAAVALLSPANVGQDLENVYLHVQVGVIGHHRPDGQRLVGPRGRPHGHHGDGPETGQPHPRLQ